MLNSMVNTAAAMATRDKVHIVCTYSEEENVYMPEYLIISRPLGLKQYHHSISRKEIK